MIDWTFLFLAWEIKGKYPAMLDQPEARELFDDANTMLDEIIAAGSLRAEGAYGFWPAHAEGDDIVVGRHPVPDAAPADGQARRPAQPVAGRLRGARGRPPGRVRGDHPRRRGAGRPYEQAGDDYRSIMVKALADRLAEAFAEYLHLEARRAWYEPDADPVVEDLHAERFRGIRPALGYPASPDHSLKRELFDLLRADERGIGLTESYAMTPAASVSGLLFAHPASRYFTVGRIGRDQVEDYAARRGLDVAEVEHWLRPNLDYDPA